MSLYRMKSYWLSFSGCLLAFLILFAFRLDLPGKMFAGPPSLTPSDFETVSERDTWMNIYQDRQKIGYAHKQFKKSPAGFSILETVYMRINTMGMVQDLNLRTEGLLSPDFSLSEFEFEIQSGRFGFEARGTVRDNRLTVETTANGATRRFDIHLKRRPTIATAVLDAVKVYGLEVGDHYELDLFDPVTMNSEPVKISILSQETLTIENTSYPATKVMLAFKGAKQFAWIGENGEVLQEKGLLGIRLEKTRRKDALAQFPTGTGTDLTRLASVPANIELDDPGRLNVLTVVVSGIETDTLHLDGGRQTLEGQRLVIRKESLDDLPDRMPEEGLAIYEKIFLEPSPLIESDHPRIRALVDQILGDTDPIPLLRLKRLLAWVYQNIEKRPVVSVPDALSTLENRSGDCNEHAVLMAALARAAGIPARIETGLAYLNGRFYYHAWNTFYLGRWITADAVFGQIPTDVTHIRFAAGAQKQIDLLGLIGNLELRIITANLDRQNMD